MNGDLEKTKNFASEWKLKFNEDFNLNKLRLQSTGRSLYD